MNLAQNSVCFLHLVTVQCTRDGQFVVVVARDVTEPMLDVDSVSLLNSDAPSCSPVGYSASFAIFQFPVTACGTAAKEVGGSQWHRHAKNLCCLQQLLTHNSLPCRRRVTLCTRTT